MLTREAWNALLKILEEPPPRVVFVFATTSHRRSRRARPDLSRLQRSISGASVPTRSADRLRSGHRRGLVADDEALRLIAKSADGACVTGSRSSTSRVVR